MMKASPKNIKNIKIYSVMIFWSCKLLKPLKIAIWIRTTFELNLLIMLRYDISYLQEDVATRYFQLHLLPLVHNSGISPKESAPIVAQFVILSTKKQFDLHPVHF